MIVSGLLFVGLFGGLGVWFDAWLVGLGGCFCLVFYVCCALVWVYGWCISLDTCGFCLLQIVVVRCCWVLTDLGLVFCFGFCVVVCVLG